MEFVAEPVILDVARTLIPSHSRLRICARFSVASAFMRAFLACTHDACKLFFARMSENSTPNRSAGGKARAEKMTPEQLSESARRAAAARWNIPRATHEGELRIGGWLIPCSNLEDGRRVISQRGFMEIIGMKGRKDIGHRISELLENPVLKSQNIKQLALDTRNPIKFLTAKNNVLAFGYEGQLIVEYCKALLYARSVGALVGHSLLYADAAEKIVIALAGVAIAALIDEATGFQTVRDRKALETLLDRYLRQEFSAWAKRFPDEFYLEIFRLKGWEWKGMKVNRPQCVAGYTNDIVYSRLEVGILKELQIRNPWIPTKEKREGYHHSLLTDDLGIPALAQLLHTVITIMRGFGAGKWERFLEFLDVSMPKRGDSVQLLLELDEETKTP